MTRILFIEDEPSSVESVRDSVKTDMPDAVTELVDFESSESSIRLFRPDIVVLDIARGNPAEEDTAGVQVYEFIWDNRFCPIVVYSANPDLLENDNHEFVTKVQKGSGSVQKVLDAIRQFLPHVQALQKTEDEIRQRLSEAMREVAPNAFRTFGDAGQRQEAIVRAGRRRVAAMMDEPPEGEETLASWECYLHPPVSKNAQLGDILIEKDEDDNEPSSFRVVLTPSCDLERSKDRQPKVEKVLVAKCCPMDEALGSIGLNPNTSTSTIKNRLLSPGYAQSVIPFPPLQGAIPAMAADLRDLELIHIDDVGDDRRYKRQASLDSPFRELVAWAYMQTACRPGLPERDLDTWAQEIRDSAQPPSNTQTAGKP